MELTVQILTIIVDLLLILFLLMLIVLTGVLIGAAKKFGQFTSDLSDLHFWVGLIKNIPRRMRNKK